MGKYKDKIVRQIGQSARRKVAKLSTEFARAESEDKEEILAAMEIERWLADTCEECLEEIE